MIPELQSLYFTAFDDGRRLFRLQGDGDLAQLRVQAWAMREALSEPWHLDIACLSTDATLSLDDVIHRPVSLLARMADGSEVERSGVVVGIECGQLGGELGAGEAAEAVERLHLIDRAASLLVCKLFSIFRG